MISDQKLATREREIAKLFLDLRSTEPELAAHQILPSRDGNPVVTSPAQRIQQILRRVEAARADDGLSGSTEFPRRSTDR